MSRVKHEMTTQNQNTRKTETTTSSSHNNDVSFPQQEGEEDGPGEIFGVILRRSCSVSSANYNNNNSSHEVLWANGRQKKNSSMESAVRRAFSMRRSPSVSVGYCKIHHQFDPLADVDDDDDQGNSTPSGRSKKKRGKILKACRRLFGF